MSSLILALSLAGFIIVAIMRITDPLLPVIARDFGVTVGDAGVAVTAFALGYGLFQLAYGPLGDRIGKLRVIAGTLSGAVVFVAACGWAKTLGSLAALRFLSGMLLAAGIPMTIAWIGDRVPTGQRQAMIARYSSGVILGQMIGTGLGGVLAEWLGWRGVFWCFAAVLAPIAALLVGMALREAPAPTTPVLAGDAPWHRYRSMLGNPSAAALLAAAFVEGFALFGCLSYLGALLHNVHGRSFASIGFILVGYGAGGLLYSLSVAWLLRCYARRGMVMIGGCLMATSFIGLAWMPHWSLAVPLVGLLGLGFYMMHNTLQTLALEMLPDARGTAFGFFAFTLFAGQGLGVWVVGKSIDRVGYTPAFTAVGVALGLLGLWLSRRAAIQDANA